MSEGIAAPVEQSNHEFRNIFDASPDPIVITRIADGRIVLINREFARLSGFSYEESVGKNPIDLGIWPDPSQRANCLVQLQEHGAIRNVEITFRSKTGETGPFLISAAFTEFNGEMCAITIARNMSDIKKIQEELVAAREAAEAASRAKSEFLSSMSHEIRTPMNSILGMAELLGETLLDPQQKQYLAMMRSNGSALLSLINDILDLAKVESGRLSLENKEFDLEALLNGVGETLGLRAREKGLALNLTIAPDVSRGVVGDSLRLRQVLINLVGNAIKFTERGRVDVTVTQESGTDGGMVHFAVVDTGIGIPADKLTEVFSSFTQGDSSTARRFGGSGLGLAIVRRLVELMGGRVWVESRVGVGSTFHFTARIQPQPIAAISAPAVSTSAAPPVSKTIDAPGSSTVAQTVEALRADDAPASNVLIVDDSPDNRFLLRAFFKRLPYRLDEAENGSVAVERFKRGRYDLVLMDMQMPVMDGYNAVGLIREWEAAQDLRRTPIIALTASAFREDVDRCVAAGCDFHVSKPVSRTELLNAVRLAIARSADPVRSEPALAADIH